MNKQQFMEALRSELACLSPEERDEALKYYEEYFDEAGPDNEQAVLNDLGSPKVVALGIKQNLGILSADAPKAPDRRETVPDAPASSPPPAQKQRMSPALIVIIVILALPIGLPIFFGLLGSVIGIAAALFSVLLALSVAGIALFAAGIGCIAGGIAAFAVFSPDGIAAIGAGFILMGLGLLITMLMVNVLAKLVPAIIRGIVNLCRRPLHKKEAVA